MLERLQCLIVVRKERVEFGENLNLYETYERAQG